MTYEGFVGIMLIVLVLMGWRILFQLSQLQIKMTNADGFIRTIEDDCRVIRPWIVKKIPNSIHGLSRSLSSMKRDM